MKRAGEGEGQLAVNRARGEDLLPPTRQDLAELGDTEGRRGGAKKRTLSERWSRTFWRVGSSRSCSAITSWSLIEAMASKGRGGEGEMRKGGQGGLRLAVSWQHKRGNLQIQGLDSNR